MSGRGPDESGLNVVESILALGVVGLLLAGGLLLHRTTVRAQERATMTLTWLEAASTLAERVRSERGPESAPAPAPSSDPMGAAASRRAAVGLWSPGPCRTRAGHEVVTVTAGPAGAGVTLDLAAPAPDPGTLELHLRDALGGAPDGVTVGLASADGSDATIVPDEAGCVVVPSTAGPVRVDVSGAHGTTSTILAAADGVNTFRVGAVGTVIVEVVLPGPVPDAIDDGDLSWWVGGAPDIPATPAVSGEARSLPVGRREVIVGTCGDARAAGAAAAVDVAAGELSTVVVQFGGVRLDRPQVADGRRITLQRSRACPGPPRRPRVVWDVGGGGGELLAGVPDGLWEVRLLDAAGRTIAGPVAVPVVGPALAEVPW